MDNLHRGCIVFGGTQMVAAEAQCGDLHVRLAEIAKGDHSIHTHIDAAVALFRRLGSRDPVCGINFRHLLYRGKVAMNVLVMTGR
jgi:hypothetical protein